MEVKTSKIKWLYGLSIFQLILSMIFIAALIYIAIKIPNDAFWQGFIEALDPAFYELNEAERFELAGMYSVGPFLFAFTSIFVILAIRNRTKRSYYIALFFLIISALSGLPSLTMPPVIVVMLIMFGLPQVKHYLKPY